MRRAVEAVEVVGAAMSQGAVVWQSYQPPAALGFTAALG